MPAVIFQKRNSPPHPNHSPLSTKTMMGNSAPTKQDSIAPKVVLQAAVREEKAVKAHLQADAAAQAALLRVAHAAQVADF